MPRDSAEAHPSFVKVYCHWEESLCDHGKSTLAVLQGELKSEERGFGFFSFLLKAISMKAGFFPDELSGRFRNGTVFSPHYFLRR